MQKEFPKYISATQISMFLECPLKYQKMYSGDVERIPPNLYIMFGTAIHHALETNYKQKISSRVDIPVETAISEFCTCFDDEVKKNLGDRYDQKIFKNLVLQGDLMIRKYWVEVAPTLQPIAVEQKFEIQMKEYEKVIIFWYFDLVTEDGIVIDHKTTGETTHKQWSQKYVDRNHQLTIYDLAYRKIYKQEPKELRIDALKRLKEWPEFAHISTHRSPIQILSLVQLMHRMKQFQELWIFYPNYSHCDSCDFSDSCSKLCIS